MSEEKNVLNVNALIHEAVHFKPRRFLTESQLWSVVEQESGGVPYFNGDEHLCLSNVQTAAELLKVTTTQIIDWARLPKTIGLWKVPSYLGGAIGKFRTESTYTRHFIDPKSNHSSYDKELVFRISSSWGLTQVMGRNLVTLGKTEQWQKKTITDLVHFASNPVWQLHWAADYLDRFLVSAKGNLLLAYIGYNAGSIFSTNPDARKRAEEVVNREITWRVTHTK